MIFFKFLVPHTCERKAWTFEIVAGATLVGHSTKKIKDRVSRQRCIEYCLQETTFDCRSIKFYLMTKLMDNTIPNPIGICVLSETDRHLTPQAFRVSRYEDEYIENQCVNTSNLAFLTSIFVIILLLKYFSTFPRILCL